MATLLVRKETEFTQTEIFADGSACYEQAEHAGYMPRPIKAVFISKEVYEEMGKPERVTVYLEPIQEPSL